MNDLISVSICNGDKENNMPKVKDYIPRLAEQTLLTKLNSSGCVIVAGPKFVVSQQCVKNLLNQ